MQTKFATLVDYMIAYNKEIRDSFPLSAYHEMSDVQFVKELCTINCNVGRRVGKSTYIDRRAGINDLVIVPGHSAKRSGLATVMTASEVSRLFDTYRGRTQPKYVNIYVDEPRLCEQYLSREHMYNILVCSKLQTFILLGTP